MERNYTRQSGPGQECIRSGEGIVALDGTLAQSLWTPEPEPVFLIAVAGKIWFSFATADRSDRDFGMSEGEMIWRL